jgi:diguanylate cyclase (GGDEF)-like protein
MAVLILVIALICLTWVTSSRDVLRWWGVYAAADRMATVNTRVDALLQAGQNLAFERGRTNVLLNAPGQAGEANLAFIAARRKAIAETLEPLLDNPAVYAMPMGNHILTEYGEVRELRLMIDEAFAQEKNARPANLASRWFALTTDLIDDIDELATLMSLMDNTFTVAFRANSRMKLLAFELRNCLGIEASRIAAAVSAESGMTEAEIEYVYSLRGQGTAIWNALRREARVAGDAAIDGGIRLIDRKFFTAFQPLQDRALGQIRTGGRGSVTTAELTAASVPALDSIGEFLSLLTAGTNHDTQDYLNESRESFWLSLILMVLSLIAGISMVLVTVFRLFIPLQRIGEQLHRLAEGDLSVEIYPVGFHDEMTRGYASVVAFRDSLIERQKLETKLLALSNSDGLTGLANRRCLDTTLQAEWHRATRSGEPISIAMFDVDFFKKYNDSYGHLAGDECLKAIARILGAHARRPGDLAARFGGEEFVVILPGLSREKAIAWADEIRKEVIKRGISHDGSPTGTVTVSAGVVSLIPEKDTSVLEILRLADEALYRAKAEGRNRVSASE